MTAPKRDIYPKDWISVSQAIDQVCYHSIPIQSLLSFLDLP